MEDPLTIALHAHFKLHYNRDNLYFQDTHTTKYLHGLAPDITVTLGDVERPDFIHVVTVIEVKLTSLAEKFKGQLLKYLKLLCPREHLRQSITGCLITKNSFLFIRWDAVNEEYSESPIYNLSNDWNVLDSFLRMTEEEHGYHRDWAPNTPHRKFIARGYSSLVFEHISSDQIVKKFIGPKAVEMANREYEVLEHLRTMPTLCDHIPRAAQRTSNDELILSPKAVPITQNDIDPKRLVEMMRFFYDLYETGYIHRDVRCENLLLAHDKFLVIDWGTSFNISTGESAEFVGTIHFASDNVLGSLMDQKDIIYQRSDDMISLLRTSVIMMKNGHDRVRLMNIPKTNFSDILAFWKEYRDRRRDLGYKLFEEHLILMNDETVPFDDVEMTQFATSVVG